VLKSETLCYFYTQVVSQTLPERRCVSKNTTAIRHVHQWTQAPYVRKNAYVREGGHIWARPRSWDTSRPTFGIPPLDKHPGNDIISLGYIRDGI